jgi:hypothetical protein
MHSPPSDAESGNECNKASAAPIHFMIWRLDNGTVFVVTDYNKNKTNSVALVRKRTIPTERPPLVREVSANFSDRGSRVVSATNPHGR